MEKIKKHIANLKVAGKLKLYRMTVLVMTFFLVLVALISTLVIRSNIEKITEVWSPALEDLQELETMTAKYRIKQYQHLVESDDAVMTSCEEEIQKLKEQEKGEERNERIRELLRRREAAKSVGGITDGERTTAQSDTDDFLRKLEAQERASKEKRSDHRSEQTTAGIKQYSYRSRKQTFGAEQEVKGRDEQVEEYDEEFEQCSGGRDRAEN